MPITLKQASNLLPVSVEMVKLHTVVSTHDIEDEMLIEAYIKATVDHGQNLTGRRFVQSTFECDLDEFPSGSISLLPELQYVTSVKYTDTDDQEVTLDASEYEVKKTSLVGFIRPVVSWPNSAKNIVVDFDAGWPVSETATKTATTPEAIKAWIMVRVAGMYEHRENFILSTGGKFGVAAMPSEFVDHMLDCYVVPGLGAGI